MTLIAPPYLRPCEDSPGGGGASAARCISRFLELIYSEPQGLAAPFGNMPRPSTYLPPSGTDPGTSETVAGLPKPTPPMPLSKDLVAASATPIVLGILRRGDSYGYEIIRQVRESSGGALEWADGMLYPILHRIEKQGWVEAYWGRSETGRRRKYYRLLEAGRAELERQRQVWSETYTLVQRWTGATA
jgi:PadR family transcriptional regulator, regulatory protein PadR